MDSPLHEFRSRYSIVHWFMFMYMHYDVLYAFFCRVMSLQSPFSLCQLQIPTMPRCIPALPWHHWGSKNTHITQCLVLSWAAGPPTLPISRPSTSPNMNSLNFDSNVIIDLRIYYHVANMLLLPGSYHQVASNIVIYLVSKDLWPCWLTGGQTDSRTRNILSLSSYNLIATGEKTSIYPGGGSTHIQDVRHRIEIVCAWDPVLLSHTSNLYFSLGELCPSQTP